VEKKGGEGAYSVLREHSTPVGEEKKEKKERFWGLFLLTLLTGKKESASAGKKRRRGKDSRSLYHATEEREGMLLAPSFA